MDSVPRFLHESDVRNLLTALIIYSMFVLIVLLDLWVTHRHYREFVDFGDAEAYCRRLIPLRKELSAETPVIPTRSARS